MDGKTGITAVCLVKNEERWVWFAIMSVLPLVDRVIIGDTGSTDATASIIKSVDSPKVSFSEHGPVTRSEFTELRQKQLDACEGDWTLVLDGDEIWTEAGVAEARQVVSSPDSERALAIVNPYFNCMGDVHHVQDPRLGTYTIAGVTGTHTLRLFNRRFGRILCSGPYGVEGYYTEDGKNIGDIVTGKTLVHMRERYFHTSYLIRSNTLLGDWKIPYRRGKFLNVRGARKLPSDVRLPEVFFREYPDGVADPLRRAVPGYFIFFGFASRLAYAAWKVKVSLSKPT